MHCALPSVPESGRGSPRLRRAADSAAVCTMKISSRTFLPCCCRSEAAGPNATELTVVGEEI